MEDWNWYQQLFDHMITKGIQFIKLPTSIYYDYYNIATSFTRIVGPRVMNYKGYPIVLDECMVLD